MANRDDPATAGQAMAAAADALGWLASADATALTPGEQANWLRELERLEARLTAARAAVLASFNAAGGYEDDAAAGCTSWLRWQTRVTGAAAAGAVGWMRRLARHPVTATALADGQISASWARQVCDWIDKLPWHCREQAEAILVDAALAGAALEDLSVLAAKIAAQAAQCDHDSDDDGFADRSLSLDRHWRGAGRLRGDLTAEAAETVQAVLDALGKKTGPEDTRNLGQRRHDALVEACRRLIASGCLPDRGGQPTQILLHMTLNQLMFREGADMAAASWAGPGTGAPPGAECDATIVPIVTGDIDPNVLNEALTTFRDAGTSDSGGIAVDHSSAADSAVFDSAANDSAASDSAANDRATDEGAAADFDDGSGTKAMADRAARAIIIDRAVRLLSGPQGLAGWLRFQLTSGPAASVSLPLDVGTAIETIPAHIRRAVAHRDQHCRFPGCTQRPAACQVHHLIPRSEGGPTSLDNCILLCAFHHLIAIHRWQWELTLNPDGTTTARDPAGIRTLHSYVPPVEAA